MAVIPNKPGVTWNGVTSVRPPVAGDIATQFNHTTFEDEYAMYDGTQWLKMNNMNSLGAPYMNSTVAKNINGGTITSNGSSYTTAISNKPTISATERELIFEFLKHNMRVAEYIQGDGKPPIVQLEMRAGEGYVWEQVKRVKTTDPL